MVQMLLNPPEDVRNRDITCLNYVAYGGAPLAVDVAKRAQPVAGALQTIAITIKREVQAAQGWYHCPLCLLRLHTSKRSRLQKSVYS